MRQRQRPLTPRHRVNPARGLRRSGLLRSRCPESAQDGAVQLLLCSLYGSRWHGADEEGFLRLAEVLCQGLAPAGPGGGHRRAQDDEAESINM